MVTAAVAEVKGRCGSCTFSTIVVIIILFFVVLFLLFFFFCLSGYCRLVLEGERLRSTLTCLGSWGGGLSTDVSVAPSC